MKIVCDNCATKYSIADEKVRGKVFKIRCKKCSHIIVVRGGADGNAEASRDAAAQTGESFATGGEEQPTVSARGGGASDAVWHLVIDREQVGPMTPAEVRAKFADGAVDVETYAWREGFGDWLRLGSIEDFRDLGGAGGGADDGATRRSDTADLFAGAGSSDEGPPATEGGADLFGGGAPAPSFSSTPAPAASEDVFGGGGAALFGAPGAAAPAPRPQRTSSPGFAAAQAAAEPAPASPKVGEVRPMTGQRNENSVLFSLNNLQALATGGGGAKAAPAAGASSSEARPGFASSQTEGSGLIDIRAMAASTLAASPGGSGSSAKGEELPGLGSAPVFSPMAAPILMPAAPSGPPKWMWAILGVGVAAVLGIVVVGVLLLTKKTPETAVAVAPAATAPAAAAAAPAAPAAAAPAAAAPTAAAPAAAAPGAVAANDAKDDAKKHHKDKVAAAGVKVAKNDPAKAESAPPPVAAPAPAAPKKSKHDELDDLLNSASPGETPKSRKKASDEGDSGGSAAAGGGGESLPDQLDKQQIVGGMTRVKSRVADCYTQYKVPGMVSVALTIGNSGHVTNATSGGSFAGTPTGDCVARAVKSATFPRFKGSPQSINYPFILR
jgi:predicted Zn finger-like uncharacterized protein